jgi:putative transcriptional regulator
MSKTIKRPSVSNRLRAALTEVHESLTGGKPLTARTVEVREPEEWNAARIKRIRAELRLSQSPFAQLIGVSPELVEHWEQSVTKPHGAASRLLTEIARDPAGYLSRYVTHRPSKKAG